MDLIVDGVFSHVAEWLAASYLFDMQNEFQQLRKSGAQALLHKPVFCNHVRCKIRVWI
jgi:hypothetical protein